MNPDKLLTSNDTKEIWETGLENELGRLAQEFQIGLKHKMQ